MSKITGSPSRKNMVSLKAAYIDTPLSTMLAIADDAYVYALLFVHTNIEDKIKHLSKKMPFRMVFGTTAVIEQLERELQMYFAEGITTFKTPVYYGGTLFQRQVWQQLRQIAWAQTCSYKQLAQAIGCPKAVRAVAQANSANPLPLIVPCHRVVQANGELGGYNGGVETKKWLLRHEGENY
jgi:AraC family transcriptional regulator of adaptative response/methylated-DNA-[protein]-cysteine methyltransferase